jgi:Skp family chaperone for outer membrane proteins
MPEQITITQAELDAKIEEGKKGVIGELTSVREENRGMKAKLDQIQKDFDAMKATADKASQEAEKTSWKARASTRKLSRMPRPGMKPS